jgi:hypothetical protein
MNAVVTQSVIALAFAVFIVLRFARRELVEQTITLRRLWVRPVVLVAMTAYLIWINILLDTEEVVAMVVALGAGIALGVATGAGVVANTRIAPAGRPGAIRTRGNWITFGIWIAALALRLAAHYAVPHGEDPRAELPLNCGTVALVASAFIVIALAFSAAIRRTRRYGPVST